MNSSNIKSDNVDDSDVRPVKEKKNHLNPINLNQHIYMASRSNPRAYLLVTSNVRLA